MKKLSVLLLALLLVFAFASCGVLELPANTDAAQAALDAAFSETKLEVSEDFTLDKKLVDEFGHTYEIVWTSSNEAVATVVDGADKVTVKVTPSYFENVVVKLTGTITEGDVTASVTLTYTVPQNKVCVHDYKVIKTLAATCCDDGYEAYECNNCGRQYMVTLFATEEHDFKAIETVAPTCTEKGYTVYECTVGGTQKADDIVDALGHEWEFVEHVDAEAFTTHGYDLYICTVCEAEKLENVVHVYDYEATQYTVPPTCTENGKRAMFCYVCLLEGVQEYEWQTIPATGHDYVDGVCSVCEAVDPDYYAVVSIADALAAADGKQVQVSGTVCAINSAWSDSYGNISVTIVDAEGNQLYLYRLGTKVALGDIITAKGVMATYNEARQMAQGGTATIDGHDSSYDYEEMTVAEAIAAADGTNVIVTGTVVEINTAYSSSYNNISVTIADENGVQLYIYRLSGGDTLAVNDIITIKGAMATYSGARQITGGTYTDTGADHTCSNYTEATCTELAACIVCGTTTGELKDHNYENGVCTECGLAEGVQYITASKTIAELITELGWTDSTTKQTFTLDDNVTVKINGGSNTGKAYNGDHIRIYATDSPAGTITISVPEGYELVSIKITTLTGTYAFLYVDGTSTDISNVETAVSGNSVVLNSVKNGTNGKQVRVTAIEVVYRAV